MLQAYGTILRLLTKKKSQLLCYALIELQRKAITVHVAMIDLYINVLKDSTISNVCDFINFRYERGFAPNVALAPRQPKLDVDDISDDEGNIESISPVATCSKPEYKEWDLPSESDDSSQTSDGRLNSSPTSQCLAFFVLVSALWVLSCI